MRGRHRALSPAAQLTNDRTSASGIPLSHDFLPISVGPTPPLLLDVFPTSVTLSKPGSPVGPASAAVGLNVQARDGYSAGGGGGPPP